MNTSLFYNKVGNVHDLCLPPEMLPAKVKNIQMFVRTGERYGI